MARQSHSDNALWFFAGAALGATIALLYAPQSGEDTRRQIKGVAKKGAGQLADTGRQIADLGRELYDKGRQLSEDASSLVARGREIINSPEFEEEA